MPSPYIDFTYSPYVALFFACSENIESENFVLFAINQKKFVELTKKYFERELKKLKYDELQKLGVSKEEIKNWIRNNPPRIVEFVKFLKQRITNNFENKKEDQKARMAKHLFSNLERYDIFNELVFEPYPESFNTRMIRQQGCFIYDSLDYEKLKVSDLEEFIDKFNLSEKKIVLYKWIIPSHFKKDILKKLDLMNINGISLYGDETGAVLDTTLKDDIPFDLADSKIDFS